MEVLQSNICYYVRIKGVIVRNTRFLCMHDTLVHAQHSCACTRVFRGIPKGGLVPKGVWGRSWGIPLQTPNGGLGLELFDDCCSSRGFSPTSPPPSPLQTPNDETTKPNGDPQSYDEKSHQHKSATTAGSDTCFPSHEFLFYDELQKTHLYDSQFFDVT